MLTRLIFALGAAGLCAGVVSAQALKDRVLVVYNSYPTHVAESKDVADDYIAKRSMAANRLCPVSFPNAIEVHQLDWIAASGPRNAIRACLSTLAASNVDILYIVMTYKTPYLMYRPGANSSAIDSYVADIWDSLSVSYLTRSPVAVNRYHDDAQSQGNVYSPFLTLASYRTQPRAQRIYSVWRLDGPSVAIAKGLVQKAITAEVAGGVDVGAGRKVYLDRTSTGDGTDFQTASGDVDLVRSSQFAAAALGAGNVVVDTAAAEFGVGSAPNAMLYCGWYSFNNYNPAGTFTWPAGAIGWHLDSGSALSPRSGSNWVANALLDGVTVTSGAMNEPFLQGMAHPDIVFRHLLAGGNVGDAFLRGTRWLRWMILNFGDPLYVPFPGGRAPFIAPPNEASLQVNGQEGIVGGFSTTGTVTLAVAPLTNQAVSLSATPGISIPSSVTVLANQRKASFAITSSPVTPIRGLPAVITAGGPVSLTNTLGLYPMLGGVAAPEIVTHGTTTVGLVSLNGRAPAGGTTVLLSSDNPAALIVPASVMVPFGASTAQFPITACSLSCPALPATVKITGTNAGAESIATVLVN